MTNKVFRVLLCGLIVWGSLASSASAAIIDTGAALDVETRNQQIELIQAQMAREDVQKAMMEMGVDPLEAQHRVASLSDHELIQLEQQLDTLPAGGDGLLAVIGVVFVVLLILEIVGVTDVFKGT